MRKFLIFLVRYLVGFALFLSVAWFCSQNDWPILSNIVSLLSFAYLLLTPIRAFWLWGKPEGNITSPKLYRLWFLNAFNDKS